MSDASEWVTLEEAAALLHVSDRTLRRYTQQGRVPSYPVGENQRWRRIRRADLPGIREQLSGGVLASPLSPVYPAAAARPHAKEQETGQHQVVRFSVAHEAAAGRSPAGVEDWFDHSELVDLAVTSGDRPADSTAATPASRRHGRTILVAAVVAGAVIAAAGSYELLHRTQGTPAARHHTVRGHDGAAGRSARFTRERGGEAITLPAPSRGGPALPVRAQATKPSLVRTSQTPVQRSQQADVSIASITHGQPTKTPVTAAATRPRRTTAGSSTCDPQYQAEGLCP
jgi:excisionase family DNA binding protein